MAWIFSLAIECGENEPDAHSMAEQFNGQILSIPSVSDIRCETHVFKDAESHWWADIHPLGASAGGVANAKLQGASELSDLGCQLYNRLRNARPLYRYALAGLEVSGFRYFSEIDKEIIDPSLSGLVISTDIWKQLGMPALFQEFNKEYRWIPYLGESKGI